MWKMRTERPVWTARCNELIALLVIGDGVAALVQPERHMNLWKDGPGPWREFMRPFVQSTELSRAAGVLEIAVGLWWASRQQPPRSLGLREGVAAARSLGRDLSERIRRT